MPALKALLTSALLALALTLTAARAEDAKGIAVTKPWARATPGGATVGAAYAEITNTGTAADTLISVSSPLAARAEIHTHAEVDGVMTMRRLETLTVPAGQSAVLGPGGNHIMLFDLTAALKAGERVPLTFVFESAGEVRVEAEIAAIGASGPGAGGAKAVKGSDSGSGTGAGSGSGK